MFLKILDILLKLILIAGLALVAFIWFLGRGSADMAAPGLDAGGLAICSEQPNCVSSMNDPADSHYVKPLAADSIVAVATAIGEVGGEVTQQNENSLSATFTSVVFRFVDDLQVMVDSESGEMQIRSASRVGRSDLGVNRARVEKLRSALGN